ncbi:MAG: TonB C-terminal domain-containing protein [Desulfobacterales bacterium]|nr:TonB C-terminal domain-containing protein [Desulfobacterales bacterium]
MKALLAKPDSNNMMDPKWSKMLILSLFLHVAIFSTILFVPGYMPTPRIRGTVYEENLVEMPGPARSKTQTSAKAKTGKRLSAPKKAAPTRRIRRTDKKKKPVVIAKRTLAAKKKKPGKPKVSPSRLIDRAVSKIEKKVKAEKKDPIGQAITRIATRVKTAGSQGSAGGLATDGIIIAMYKQEVEDWIKSNWSYAVDLTSPERQKDLKAVVVVKVKSNGTIIKSWFKERSKSVIYDQSVLKAVERSDPLPPFPEGYRRTFDEFEINFDLSDLEEQ